MIVKSKQGLTKGIVVDGDIKRAIQKNKDIQDLAVRNIMTKSPMSIDRNELAAKALSLMNSKKKITSLCVYDKRNKLKTIGIIHIHNILENNIT